MMKLATTIICGMMISAAIPGRVQAQGAEQIRVADFCSVYSKRLKAQLANPLYQKALDRKKHGNLLPMSRARLEYVEQLRAGLKQANCR